MEVSTSAYYAWCLATETGGDTQEDQVLADTRFAAFSWETSAVLVLVGYPID